MDNEHYLNIAKSFGTTLFELIPHVVGGVLAYFAYLSVRGLNVEVMIFWGILVVGIGGAVLLGFIAYGFSEDSKWPVAVGSWACFAVHIILNIHYFSTALYAGPRGDVSESSLAAFNTAVWVLAICAFLQASLSFGMKITEHIRTQERLERQVQAEEMERNRSKAERKREEQVQWERAMKNRIDNLFR